MVYFGGDQLEPFDILNIWGVDLFVFQSFVVHYFLYPESLRLQFFHAGLQTVKTFSQWYADVDNFVHAQVNQSLLEVLNNDLVHEVQILRIFLQLSLLKRLNRAEIEKNGLNHAYEGLSVVVRLTCFEELHFIYEV